MRRQTSRPPPSRSTSGDPFGERIQPRKQNRSATPPVVDAPLNEFQRKRKEIEDMKMLGAILLIQAYFRGWKARRRLRGTESPRRRWSWDGNRPTAAGTSDDHGGEEGSASRQGSGESDVRHRRGNSNHRQSAASMAVIVLLSTHLSSIFGITFHVQYP